MARERVDLGAEAVKINGIYLEDAISGFTTLRTTGREVLTKEINTSSYKSDGSVFDDTRYPERIITVEYVIQTTSLQDYRDKYTQLLGMLDGEEVDIQFNDDINKFLTGTISVDEPDEKYGLVCHGTYTVKCANPFKYSTAVYTATPTSYDGASAQFVFNYNGTYPAHPVLQAEFAGALVGGDYSDDGDCGYVAFMDEDENIIQLGNPEAIDLDASKTAGQIVNRVFTTIADFSTTGGKTWGNKAISGSSSPNITITDANWNKGASQSLKYVKPTYGSGSAWHGPILHYPITNGAQNFEISLVHRLNCDAAAELGSFECGAYNINGSTYKMVAGIVIDKTANGTNGTVRYIVDGVQRGTATIDLSYYNTNFGYCKKTAVNQTQWYNKKKKKWQTTKIKGAKTRTVITGYNYTQSNLNTSIKKAGSVYTFKVGNLAAVSYTVGNTENLLAHNVSLHFGANGTNAALHTNAVSTLKFTRNAGASFADTDNVFTAGDIIEADCSDASIYLKRAGTQEGQVAQQYGALANDWEYFTLTKGTNTINATWSPWVNSNYKPTLKIIYNEVFI